MIEFARRLAADDRGATAIEYAVLITFLGVALVSSLGFLQAAIYGVINRVTTAALAATT